MALQGGKAAGKSKGGRRLKAKRQPLKDLEAREGRGQRVKGAANRIVIHPGP